MKPAILRREVEAAARNTLAATGAEAVERMRGRLPADVRDTEWARSIGFHVDGTTLIIQAGTESAMDVEYGTLEMPARPFIGPVLQGLKARAEAAVFGAVTNAIDKVLK